MLDGIEGKGKNVRKWVIRKKTTPQNVFIEGTCKRRISGKILFAVVFYWEEKVISWLHLKKAADARKIVRLFL